MHFQANDILKNKSYHNIKKQTLKLVALTFLKPYLFARKYFYFGKWISKKLIMIIF
jgi:hypothetical protein